MTTRITRSTGLLPALGAALVLIAACGDPINSPAAPDLTAPQHTLSISEDVDLLHADLGTTGNHVVVFNRERVPDDFAQSVAALGGALELTVGAIGVAVVRGLNDETAESLGNNSQVRYVFPDYLLPLAEPVESWIVDAPEADAVANDDPSQAQLFNSQWHLHRIQAPAAWAAGFTGSAAVTVAILDTGIDYTHIDLAGLVDLDRSVSFVPTDDVLVQQFYPGAHPVADLHWHGSHVASTVSSNAVRAAGVTSKTTLVGVKVCNVNGSCPFSGVLAGVVHAADVGADIMNLSLGGFSRHRDSPGFIATIERAFNYARRNGTLPVVAAGNNGMDIDHIEDRYFRYCQISATVCVSATNSADNRAGFSNHGRSSIDVGAPGQGVIASCSHFSRVRAACRNGTNVLVSASGTSMASPNAAGVAALIAAHTGAQGPAQIGQRLKQTAEWIDSDQLQGTTKDFGRGRVNAAHAVGVN